MRIGLSYDLKEDHPLTSGNADDAFEEYDAPETVKAISAAIGSLGHSVVRLGGGREFLRSCLTSNGDIDFVFNIAEGRGTYRSREAQVPSVLEMLGIPYCGSDPQCLAICLDKPLTLTLLKAAGVRVPRWQVVPSLARLEDIDWGKFPLPAFVKPAFEGSSKGVRLTCRADSVPQIKELSARIIEQYHQPATVEEFLAGDEVTVGVGGWPPRVIGIMRILPKRGPNPDFVYSLEVKRDYENLVTYECPAQYPARTMKAIERMALKTFAVLGCNDMSRIDIRVRDGSEPYVLEINPLPGLRPGYSDLTIMAQKMGLHYNSLVNLILDGSLRRQGLSSGKQA